MNTSSEYVTASQEAAYRAQQAEAAATEAQRKQQQQIADYERVKPLFYSLKEAGFPNALPVEVVRPAGLLRRVTHPGRRLVTFKAKIQPLLSAWPVVKDLPYHIEEVTAGYSLPIAINTYRYGQNVSVGALVLENGQVAEEVFPRDWVGLQMVTAPVFDRDRNSRNALATTPRALVPLENYGRLPDLQPGLERLVAALGTRAINAGT